MTVAGALALAGPSVLHALAWWFTLLALNAVGWLALRPATSAWHDAGWAVARPLAMLAFAYAVWVAAHLLPVFTPYALWALVAAAAVAAVALRRRGPAIDRDTVRRIVGAELRFAAPFAFYAAMRGFSHDVIGLEKFMDFAIMNSALATASMPVPDPWFAGEAVNYYYFGHYVAAFLCKLSGTPAAYGYNLMLATLFGTTFQLAYAFVAEMTRQLAAGVRGAMALVAGVWLTVGGNVHGFLYGFVKPWLIDAGLAAVPRQAFLLSDPTRFVGYDPLTDDKLIHEFPAYAFYVGDLHAHLSNLPTVLLLACVLLSWFRMREDARTTPAARRGWLLAAAWLVGLFSMANSWDALMYGAMLGVLLTAHAAAALRQGAGATVAALGDGVRAAAVTAATALPFVLYFRTHGAGFLPTHSHTPVWQWLVLYGLQSALALAGCAAAWRGRDALLAAPERRLLAVFTAFGIGFALVPEFVYLKDIYGADYYRANTAFKFGFQAFTLLTLGACVGTALLLSVRAARIPRIAVVILLELALVPPLYYAWFFAQGGFGVWREREWTLDGQRYLALSHPEDQALTAWLSEHGGRQRSLVEAPGESYTFGARISTNTGIPAVLGWPVHEQLWRGGNPDVWARRDDANRIYEARSAADAKAVLERYRPRWLVVGRFERERYPALDAGLLASLGCVAFRSGDSFIVDLDRPAAQGEAPKDCADR